MQVNHLNELLFNFIGLFLDSAPWLLLGLVLAGLLKMFVPMAWMHQQLGGHGFKSTVKAALLGAPLPLCSCGVIPAAVGLRRSGASKAATTSFLVSTPETGVDSIAVSYVLLGPFMAIVRPIAAVCSAIVAGLLVGRDEKENDEIALTNATEKAITETKVKQDAATASCCGHKKEKHAHATEKVNAHSHEGHKHQHDHATAENNMAESLHNESVVKRIIKGLHFAATDLIRDTTVWLLVGLFFAALVQTYVPTDFMLKWGDGILAMLVMVLISIPMYICATASTPIAAGLLLAGISPGAVLVFMLAGPATNIATLGVVANELGKRALLGYLGGVIGVALVSGILVNYLVATFGFVVMPQIGGEGALLPAFLIYGSGIVLTILMIKALVDMLLIKYSHKACCA